MDEAAILEARGALVDAVVAWRNLAVVGDAGVAARALGRAARLLLVIGRRGRAEASLQAAERAARAAGAVALERLGGVRAAFLLHAGDAAGAIVLARAALAAASPDERVDALLDLSRALVDAGRSDEALAVLDDASRACAGSSVSALQVQVGDGVARIARGDVDEAARRLSGVPAAAAREGLFGVQADALTALGRCAVDQRDYARARSLHEAALALHTRHGNRPGVVASLGGLGLCRLGTRLEAEGASYLQRAIRLCAELDAPAVESAWRAHLDAALVLLDRAEWRAIELRRWLEVVRRVRDAKQEAVLLRALAGTLHEVRRDDDALVTWHEARTASAALGDTAGQVDALRGVARTLARLGRADEATAYEAEAQALG